MSSTDFSTPKVIVDLREQITALREQLTRTERELALARVDPITGLPTRRYWTSLAVVHRRPASTVLLADLDGFKAINDGPGHSAGDAVLAKVAFRLKAGTPPGSFVGRLGGDEFALITARTLTEAELNRLVTSATSPVQWNGRDLHVGISIGAAVFADLPGASLSAALAAADRAMYQAKRSGGGWRIYDAERCGFPKPVHGRRETDPPDGSAP